MALLACILNQVDAVRFAGEEENLAAGTFLFDSDRQSHSRESRHRDIRDQKMWFLRASSDQGEQRICEGYRVKAIGLKDLSQRSRDDSVIVNHKDPPYRKSFPGFRSVLAKGFSHITSSLSRRSEFRVLDIQAPNNAGLTSKEWRPRP
jgi:hypothetical protein